MMLTLIEPIPEIAGDIKNLDDIFIKCINEIKIGDSVEEIKDSYDMLMQKAFSRGTNLKFSEMDDPSIFLEFLMTYTSKEFYLKKLLTQSVLGFVVSEIYQPDSFNKYAIYQDQGVNGFNNKTVRETVGDIDNLLSFIVHTNEHYVPYVKINEIWYNYDDLNEVTMIADQNIIKNITNGTLFLIKLQ